MSTSEILRQKIEAAKVSKKLDLAELRGFLSELPEEIFKLEDLEFLKVKGLRLGVLPSEISKLSKLKFLNLRKTRLTELPPEIGSLKFLAHLNIAGNGFTTFPEAVLQLRNLKNLYLSGNKIQELPEEIAQLEQLEVFMADNMALRTLPKSLVNLPLRRLDISKNQIQSLPDNISRLDKLQMLLARSNPIEELPQSVTELRGLRSIRLEDTLLRKPPLEVAIKGLKAIREYFKYLEEQGEDYIFEAKLILIGEPAAGKTTLAEKLINPNYPLNPTEPMTKGIQVYKWTFPYNRNISFSANVWDFGGQEIMHATHRYFLTKRSLYILVADNRKEDTDFYYWLKWVDLFSAQSPILIVLNEKDNHKRFVPSDILRAFQCIRGVYAVNLSDNRGLNSLVSAIKTELGELPHIGREPIPRKWVEVRRKIENETREYISKTMYLEICGQYGIDEEQGLRISEFLHDLGVVLHFQQDRILKNTVILSTRWATEAVYLILFDEAIILNGGEFNNSHLDKVWATPEYSEKHADLLQLMINFELCYEIRNTQTYIIPQLLPNKPQNYEWDSTENLVFEYRYAFMPKGIISRLIVRLNRYIFNQMQWKTGVLLKIEEAIAEVKEDYFQKTLKIRISGNDKRECLAIIRKEMREIHETFDAENLVDEMIPCICKDCKSASSPYFYKYEVLKKYASRGRLSIICETSIEDVNVSEMLSGVIDERGENSLSLLGNIRGTLFEQVIEKLLSLIYPATNIERGKKFSEIIGEGGIKEEYEYDFIITNHRQKEIIILEAKGYYKEKKIKLGDSNTKETVRWFFGRTFPFSKRVIPNPSNYAIKGCYITWGVFTEEALQFLEIQNESRLKPASMDVFYDNSKIRDLLRSFGLVNEIKDLQRYFS